MPTGRLLAADILVVEDDPKLNRLYCRALQHEGYVVEAVLTRSEALAYLQTHVAPAVAIIDLFLGDENSLDIIEFLQPARQSGQSKLIVVSGNAYDPDAPYSLNQVNYALQKPVSPRQLVALITSLLRVTPASK